MRPAATIGDSHCRWTFLGSSWVFASWLGPLTMHRIATERPDIAGIARGRLEPLDASMPVLHCFGEIDVRCHLNTPERVGGIPRLASAYLDAVESHGWRSAVMSVMPPSRSTTEANEHLPYRGTDAERLSVTRLLNASLLGQCMLRNVPFLDVYRLYADDEGMLDPGMSDGNVHVGASFTGLAIGAYDEMLRQRGW